MVSTATLFHDLSKAGISTTLALGSSETDNRYELRRFTELSQPGLAFSISCATLSRGRVVGDSTEASLYLFGGNSVTIPYTDLRRSIPNVMLNMRAPLPFIQDFHGDFLRMTLHPHARGQDATQEINDLGLHQFNDRTTSAMLVNRFRGGKPETTISASDTFTLGWKAVLSLIIPITQVALGGGVAIFQIQDPVFTWVAFPPATPNVPNNYVYMVLSQWFVFHASGIGVNVWLMVYLRLARDNSGKLAVNVVELDRYVWPGTGQGQMYTAIDGAKASIMSGLSNAAGLILGDLAQVHCDDVYLLPGKQPNAPATQDGIVLQDAMSDVTIVLENQH